MLYVVNKYDSKVKIAITLIVVYLLCVNYEGFMSEFDGIELKGPKNSYNLIDSSRKISALLGSGYVPLNDHIANDNKDSMFVFKDNTCSPSCCPSTYSCNGGCVCTTDQQNNLRRSQGAPAPMEPKMS